MTLITSRLVCAACGWTPGPIEVDPYPFRCPRAGTDDGDHVIRKAGPKACSTISDVGRDFSPAESLASSDLGLWTSDDGAVSQNPFIRYRTSFRSWHVAQAFADKAGLKPCSTDADRDYCSIVERVDAAIARVAGCGFRVTPFYRSDRLSGALGFDASGGVWVKDETGNVSGSHKARHLMGVALYLEVLRRLGVDRGTERPLAVASCGNAALAAAVVARAIGRKLLVFVPDHASSSVVAQLEQLGAVVTRCSRATPPSGAGDSTSDSRLRTPDSGRRDSASDFGLRTSDFGRRHRPPGDPAYLAFRRAVDDGALAFSCQGNENGLVIEGGETLGYEIADVGTALRGRPVERQARDPAATPNERLDRVFIQVGGGALASACVQAFTECVRAGRLTAMPRIHAVQTCGGFPLKRAYDLVVDHIFARLVESASGTRVGFATDDDRARYLLRAASPALLDEAFAYGRTHRSQFMWPWETEPRSIAGGILDDETYDWAAVVEGMVRSGGFPVVVDEPALEEANALAREATGIDVDHTGSSGLAGLVALTRSLDTPRPNERITVLFTGVRR